jgi:ribosomal protein L11 methyltransferase
MGREGEVSGRRPVARAVEVVVAADEVDLASGLLWGAGVTAVAEHAEGDRVRLRADVPAGGIEAVRVVLAGRWSVTEVEVIDDGLDAWRAHAEVVAVGRRLVVRPPWVPRGDVPPGAVVVEIDPGPTFGHGAHPTTRLCLAAVEEALAARPGATVLDVGSGSGVLAVAAARLGATRVVAVDIDPAAVEATGANTARNGVAHVVTAALVPGTGPDGGDPLASVPGRYDVVVANIGAAALVALAPSLVARRADGATLVLSGLLDPPPPEVAAACAPLVVTTTPILDGWAALILTAS